SSLQQRPRARGSLEREAAADGGAGRDALDLARRTDEVDDPREDEIVDIDVLDRGLQGVDVTGIQLRLERRERMTVPLREHDFHLLVLRRIAERRAQREAIELR